MTVHSYFADVADELSKQSDRMRLGFSTHQLTAGENREGVVATFLRGYLPQAFGINTGLILSGSGKFSNQADVVVVDHLYNAPLFPTSPKPLWLIESVYALIEVKTSLSPTAISDSVQKCRRFKTLPRSYDTVPALPKIPDSLFVLWAFNAPKPKTIKKNVIEALKDVPRAEHPDFIVIPNSTLVTAGHYREISKLGMVNSPHRAQVLAATGGNIELALGDPIKVIDLGNNTLLNWLIWFSSWLKAAGHRSASLASYLEQSRIFGTVV